MQRRKWSCSKCGLCCVNTINEIEGVKFGMNLLPHETLLFPERYVKPMFGVGDFIKNKNEPESVIMYQNISQPCIYYDSLNHNCRIYDDRPLVCKSFPLEPTVNGVLAHLECPEMKKILNENETFTSDMIEGFDNEIQAVRLMHFYYYAVFEINPERVNLSKKWYFNYTENKWYKLTREYALRVLSRKHEKVVVK